MATAAPAQAAEALPSADDHKRSATKDDAPERRAKSKAVAKPSRPHKYRPVPKPKPKPKPKTGPPHSFTGDRVLPAWRAKKLSVDQMLRYSVSSVLAPGTIPADLRPTKPLGEGAGLYLAHALSFAPQASPETRAWLVDKLTAKPVSAQAPGGSAKGFSASAVAGATNNCDQDWTFYLHDFQCVHSTPRFNIYYNEKITDGDRVLFPGVPFVDDNNNNITDGIDTMAEAFETSYDAYVALRYVAHHSRPLDIFVGFDDNDNAGLTFPFGGIGEGNQAVILLPSEPSSYNYLPRHELFHAFQYTYISNEMLLQDLSSINWWMESTAEWAAHISYSDDYGATVFPGEEGEYANSLAAFYDAPNRALNAWDGFGARRQYSTFPFPVFLTEITADVDAVRHTWELQELPLTAIQNVLSIGYGLDVSDTMLEFARSNYERGYVDTDAQYLWPAVLNDSNHSKGDDPGPDFAAAANRPAHNVQRLGWGQVVSEAEIPPTGPLAPKSQPDHPTELQPGGALYVDFVLPGEAGRSGSIQVKVGGGGSLRYSLTTWDRYEGETVYPSSDERTATVDPNGNLTLPVTESDVFASLVITRVDLNPDSRTATDWLPVTWTARLISHARAIVSAAGCMATTRELNNDESSPAVDLPFPINFYGRTYTYLYVNDNGNVTFNEPSREYTPFAIDASTPPMIAPFFADVGGTESGSTNNALLRTVSLETSAEASGEASFSFGSVTYQGRPAFCVNWDRVGYYREHTDKLNSFQLLLVDRSDVGPGDFDIIFNYNHVGWETGDASGGDSGYGGTPAAVGFTAGTGNPAHAYMHPYSMQTGQFLDGGPHSLIANNVGALDTPGRYVFHVNNGATPTQSGMRGTVTVDGEPAIGAPVQICQTEREGACVFMTRTGADGTYDALGLNAGTYYVIAFPPVGLDAVPRAVNGITVSPESITTVDIALSRLVDADSDTTITPSFGDPAGIPVVYWEDPLVLRTAGCTGGAGSYRVVMHTTGAVLATGPMVEVDPGVYSATLGPFYPNHGYVEISITILCPDGTVEATSFWVYIDPSGTIVTPNGEPVSGATVRLLRSDTAAGPFSLVPDGSDLMSPANRNNPVTTGSSGHFGWDVVAGFYRVEASKPGCLAVDGTDTVRSKILTIPPAVTGLELVLVCNRPPELVVRDRTVEGNAAGGFAGNPEGVTSTDPDGDAVTLTNDQPAFLPLGANDVQWRAVDANGGDVTATQRVTVEDTTAPAITCPPNLVASSTAVVLGDPTVTDVVDPRPSLSNNAPASFPSGTTDVTWAAADASGNSGECVQRVTLNRPAEIVVVDRTVEGNVAGGFSGDAAGVTASDPDGNVVSLTNDQPALLPLGVTTVQWTASDGYTDVQASQQVTVVDTTPPSIVCASAGGSTLVAPAVNDVVDAEPAVANDAPAMFPAGTTTVTWTATDSSGNRGTCTQHITISGTTTAAYTGSRILPTGGSVTPAASLTASAATCVEGRRVSFSLDRHPVSGALTPFSLGVGVSSDTGSAIAPTLTAARWSEGVYRVSVSGAETSQCSAFSATGVVVVTASGLLAAGAGQYTLPTQAAERVDFAFYARRKGSRVNGAVVLVTPKGWLLAGSVTDYSKAASGSSTVGTISGTGVLWRWDPGASAGAGSWKLASGAVSFRLSVEDVAAGGAVVGCTYLCTPGHVYSTGVQISYTPPAAAPALPNSDRQRLTNGVVWMV